MLRKSISLVLILASLISFTPTYAYWASNLSSATNSANVEVTIGEWIFIVEWEPGDNYEVGDVVLWNGIYYISTWVYPGWNLQPDSQWGWIFWDEVTN